MALHTESAVLAHHGIAATDPATLRNVHLLVAVCRVCASITTAPDASSRLAYSRVAHAAKWTCCETPMVLY